MKLYIPQEVKDQELPDAGTLRIPSFLKKDPSYQALSADARLTYAYFLDKAKKDGSLAHFDQEKKNLETLLGCHEMGVERVLDELKKHKLLIS